MKFTDKLPDKPGWWAAKFGEKRTAVFEIRDGWDEDDGTVLYVRTFDETEDVDYWPLTDKRWEKWQWSDEPIDFTDVPAATVPRALFDETCDILNDITIYEPQHDGDEQWCLAFEVKEAKQQLAALKHQADGRKVER